MKFDAIFAKKIRRSYGRKTIASRRKNILRSSVVVGVAIVTAMKHVFPNQTGKWYIFCVHMRPKRKHKIIFVYSNEANQATKSFRRQIFHEVNSFRSWKINSSTSAIRRTQKYDSISD